MALPILSTKSQRARATAATLLFERLPDRLFAPLASTNRHRYWALLCRLYANRFGPDAPLPPSHGFALREIVLDIEDELLTQDIWEAEEGYSPETPINVRALQVFHRIEEAGWLRLEKVGVERRITMRPAVSQFLAVLVSFAETGPVFLSGKIRSIDLNLQQIIEGKAEGDTLSETAEQTRNLLDHVRNTGTNIRDIMESLSAEMTTGDYVRRFFSDYIEQVFIGDYRELRTKEHPLSRRQQIIRTVEELSSSDAHRNRLITWYETKRCSGDRQKAEVLFEKDIHRLIELNRIGEYLDRLDDEIRRANRRALAYLDYRLRSLRPVDHLVKQAIATTLSDTAPALGDPFPAGDMVSGDRLAEPRKSIDRATPSTLRRQQPSAAQIARARVMLRARDARSITAPKLAAFVVNRLNGTQDVRSDALALATIEDVRAYQALAGVGLAMSSSSRRLQLSATALAKGFRVVLAEEEIEPEGALIGGRSFVIERRRAPTEKS
ncbi:Wadjet anti-phage system protein JetA family protein [Burkholderia pyrrocinia]|uniref:Wadjet anti-phage system protein JetA family protein n=1 Tax=Burkholderia pyrrocinia TaxID=60550 RepID=UPI002AB01C8C|nr:Wadjet anti-phage system protein JetA family protein [Burkholderia pyrrocinia]